jgi:Bacterial sugar transferase
MAQQEKSCDWFLKSCNVQTKLEAASVESRPPVSAPHTCCSSEAFFTPVGRIRMRAPGFIEVTTYLQRSTKLCSTGVDAPAGVVREDGIARRPLAWRALESAERVAALGSLVALTPLLAAIAIAVMLLSAKAPLVAHRRVGKHGRELWLLKFRTMWGRGSARSGRLRFLEFLRESEVPECKAGADPRVTSRFATFCRKYSLDELPQLWHIWRGEMSFVGPRPLTPAELATHYREAAAEVLELKTRM